MKGVYLLLLQLDNSQQISIGRLGVQHFAKGFYAYVGSALNGIEPRVNRHISNDKKRKSRVTHHPIAQLEYILLDTSLC